MDIRDVAVEVIMQEMRYNQQTDALNKLGLEISNGYELDFFDTVAMLLGIGRGMPDSFIDLYGEYLLRSTRYEIMPNGANLYPLAEECYMALQRLSVGVKI